MFAIPVKCLRKYCVPDTVDTEPRVIVFQLPSEKLTAYQSEAAEEEVIFHSAFFSTG